MRLLPQHVGEARCQQRQADEHRHRQHESEGSANDQLDVHQTVLDHRVRKGERNERERHVSGKLHGHSGLTADGKRQGVESQERHDATTSAPDQPLDLPSRGQAPGATIGIHQDREGHGEEEREIEGLNAVDGGDDAPKRPWILAGREERLAHGRRPGQHQRRHVESRHHPQPLRAQASLGEGQAEVQEHDGQEQPRQIVGPEEHPVRGRELPRVGRRVHEEEEHANAVEVQGRAVGGTTQHHDGAHDQGEEAHERQVVEGRDVALGKRAYRDIESPHLVGPQEGVGDPLAGSSRGQHRLEGGLAQDLLAVHREGDVRHPHARARARSARGDSRGDQALGSRFPVDPVVHQAPGGLQDDVVDTQGRKREPANDDKGVLESVLLHVRVRARCRHFKPTVLYSKGRAWKDRACSCNKYLFFRWFARTGLH